MKCDELKFNLPNNLNNTSNQNKAYVWFTSTFFFEEKNLIGADDKSCQYLCPVLQADIVLYYTCSYLCYAALLSCMLWFVL